MKILDFATYIFYRYYDKGSTATIAYESALLAISLIIFMNVLALLILFGIDTQKVLPIIEDKGRGVKLLSGFLIIIPQYIILRLILPKKRIQKLTYSKQATRLGGIIMIFYIILSMVFIIFLVENR